MSSIPTTLLCFYQKLIRELVSKGFSVSAVASNQPELEELCRTTGCSEFGVEISRRISVIQDCKSTLRLIRFFRKEKPVIVHAHTPKAGFLGMLAAFIAGVPNRLYTVHGLPMETAEGMKRKVLWLCEIVACKLAHEVLAVSPSLADRLVSENICDRGHVTTLCSGTACGIDTERFKPPFDRHSIRRQVRTALSIPGNAFVIGFIGRLAPDKGIDSLINGFLQLERSQRHAYLLLAGALDKEREALPPELLSVIASHPRIKTKLEHVNPLPYYVAMDLLVLPSRREGFGLTLIEAGAMKLPVVGTRVTGCIDAVVDGQTGLLVQPDNPSQLAQAINTLIHNEQLRIDFGEAGRKRVVEKFNSKLLIASHVSLYMSMLNE